MKNYLHLFILLISASIVFGQTQYYVDPSGTDDVAHGNGTGTNAWATIQYAVNNVSDPTTANIQINIAAGTYTEVNIEIDRGFTSLALVGASAKTTIVQANATKNTATDKVIYMHDEIVTIKNLTIRNGKQGLVNFVGTVNIENCLFVDNYSDNSGGGIENNIATISIINTTFTGNTVTGASLGGAIFDNQGTVILTNCTLFKNISEWRGGGIYFNGGSGNHVITNCTIADNTKEGIYFDGTSATLSIKNTIVANSSTTDDFYLAGGTITDNGYNIVESSNTTFSGTGTLTGEQANLNISSTLADNSSLNGTQTLALSSGSVAIDAGNSSNNATVPVPTTDQRGATRSGTTDIGAFEYNGVTPVELTSFTANITEGKVILNWTTATEVNNYGFELQRSSNQASKFVTIGFIEGHGNSNSPQEYSFIDSEITEGSLSYRLKQIDIDGSFEYSDIVTVKFNGETNFKLAQNYPNPFNPSTTIKYTIPENVKGETVNVKLIVYDVLGREVATLVNQKQSAGLYSVKFDASNLTSGLYLYKLQNGNSTEIKKMLLLK